MPATIRDVARASGVHISTVSRTFSAPHLVNPETRSRVLACAEHLGYRPNRAARALITGRTHNIGLIVADIANPFFPPLIKAAESQARHRDYHIFVTDTNEDPAVEEDLVHALAKQVDGVLLCSSSHFQPQSGFLVLAGSTCMFVQVWVVGFWPFGPAGYRTTSSFRSGKSSA